MTLVQNIQKIKIIMQYAQIGDFTSDSTYGIIESPQGTKTQTNKHNQTSTQCQDSLTMM